MNIPPFNYYDPVNSFKDGGPGAQERRFYDKSGRLTYRDFQKDDQDLAFWSVGKEAYDAISARHGSAPTTTDLFEIARHCRTSELGLAKLAQELVDAGALDLTLVGADTPITNLFDHAKDADLGWATSGLIKPLMDGLNLRLSAKILKDIELTLLVSSLFKVDNCIVTHQLDSDFHETLGDLLSYITNAKSISTMLTAPQNALRENAKRGAAAKLANDPRQKDKPKVKEMWEEWDLGKVKYKSGAAFSRHVVANTSLQNEKTVERWVTAWRKEKKDSRKE